MEFLIGRLDLIREHTTGPRSRAVAEKSQIMIKSLRLTWNNSRPAPQLTGIGLIPACPGYAMTDYQIPEIYLVSTVVHTGQNDSRRV